MDAAAPSPIAIARSGDGPRSMVLIHGVGTNRSIWSRAIGTLERSRTVVAVDLPGFGDSPAPESGWRIEAVAAEIATALAGELDPPYDIVGSSLGGAVALALASSRPELVDRLVLCAPAGFRPIPDPLPVAAGALIGPFLTARRTAGLRLAGIGSARRALLAGTVADGSALDPEDARLVLRASAGATALAPAFRAAAAADLAEMALALREPPGLIWGTLDRVVPAQRPSACSPSAPTRCSS